MLNIWDPPGSLRPGSHGLHPGCLASGSLGEGSQAINPAFESILRRVLLKEIGPVRKWKLELQNVQKNW